MKNRPLRIVEHEELITGAQADTQVAYFDELLRELFNADTTHFCKSLIDEISFVFGACSGFFYLYEKEEEVLRLEAGYGTMSSEHKKQACRFKKGEGQAGQALESQKSILLNRLKAGHLQVDLGNIKISVVSILVIPLIFNGRPGGVMELWYAQKVNKKNRQTLEKIARNMAGVLEGIHNQQAMEKLLHQTEYQKEQLSFQEAELRQNLEELTAIHESLHSQTAKIQDAYEILDQYNQRINQSLEYARRMQNAILPSAKVLKTEFEDFFVIYEPKDVVSGDFYWFAQQEGKKIFAMADCTGHGIPGGFMSMIGSAALTHIVVEEKILEPHKIISALHTRIFNSLQQEESGNRDGMDLSIISIESSGQNCQKVSFAGAKSDIYAIKQETGVLREYRGDRQSIGGLNLQERLEFSTQSFCLQKGDLLYLSTDGIPDICNPQRKKFGRKNLKKMIEEYHMLSFVEQKKLFVNALKIFSQSAEQRDDISMAVIKI